MEASSRASADKISLFQMRDISDWLTIGSFLLYLVIAFALTLVTITQFYGLHPYSLGADSGTYYALAGIGSQPRDDFAVVGFGQNLLGPVLLAKLCNGPAGVAIFNFVLFAGLLKVAASIPGVSGRVFFFLLAMNAMTVASVVTLNKEIFAIGAIVLFAKYIYSEKRNVWLLLPVFFLSVMARWEQAAILLIYLLFESKLSPVRGRHLLGLLSLAGAISIAYPLALHSSSIDFAAFLAQLQVGVIVKLNAIQASYGGFLITAIPKVGMLILGGFLTPIAYTQGLFTTTDNPTDLQNRVVVPLASLAAIAVFIWAFLSGRLSFKRPLPYLTCLYLVVIAVNPFIQSRYVYPAYALMCLELSRSSTSLEPARSLIRRLSLPPSYLRGAPGVLTTEQ